MASNVIATLLVKIGVEVKEMTKGMKQVEGNLKNIGKSSGNVAGVMKNSFKAIGAAAVVGLGIAAKAGIDLEKDLAKLGAIAGVSGDELKKLKNSAQSMGAEFGIASNEVVHGLEEMSKLGFSTAESLEAIPKILQFTVSQGADFDTTVGLMEATLSDFNLELSQTEHITDVFTVALGKGQLSVENLREAFKEGAPAAKAAGFSVEELTAAVSALARKGIKGGQAGTALKSIFASLVSPTTKAANKMKELGFSMTDSNGKMKPLKVSLEELRSKFSKLDTSQKAAAATALVGKDHYAKLLALLDGAPGSFETLVTEMEKANGKTKSLFDAIDKTAGQSIEKLLSSLKNLAQNIGLALAPAIAEAANFLTEFIQTFVNADWSPVIDAITEAWNYIKQPIINAFNALVNYTKENLNTLRQFWKENGDQIIAIVKFVWDLIVAITSYVWPIIKGIIQTTLKTILGLVSFVTNLLTGNWKKAMDALKNAALNALMGTLSLFNNLLGGLPAKAFKWGVDMFTSFGRGIVAGFRYVKEKVIAAANWVKSKLGFSVPESGPLSDANTWMPDMMELFAKGIETSMPVLRSAVADVTSLLDLGQTASSSSLVNSNNNTTINVNSRQNNLDERGLGRMLERMRILNGGTI